MRPITIGVAGGTGSGKTTVALKILERVGFDHVAYMPHDAFIAMPATCHQPSAPNSTSTIRTHWITI